MNAARQVGSGCLDGFEADGETEGVGLSGDPTEGAFEVVLGEVVAAELITATGLSRDQLPGTELTIRANLAATVDTDVDPGDFQLHALAAGGQPTGTSALSRATAKALRSHSYGERTCSSQ